VAVINESLGYIEDHPLIGQRCHVDTEEGRSTGMVVEVDRVRHTVSGPLAIVTHAGRELAYMTTQLRPIDYPDDVFGVFQ
jgi:hypothetical protein